MKTRTKQLLVVIVIAALVATVYAGSAWAQSDPTTTTLTPNTMLQQMQERFGPEAWAQHIQRMTQMHGAEFVNERLAWMAQQESCPCQNGSAPGMMQQRQQMTGGMMGQGMHERGRMGQGMRSRGTMGQGMREQGGWWNFTWNRGFRFWNNTPTVAPTPAPTE